MDEENFTTEQELRDIYYNPQTGYQSAEKLYQHAKNRGLRVSRRTVKDWLLSQETYTRHKPIIKRHKFKITYVRDLADQVQLDLVDMKSLSGENNDFYWILTGIEIISRYGFAIPVRRKDTKNMTDAVDEFLEEFLKRFRKPPKRIQFDEGKEFYNVGVRKLLRNKGIEYFSTNSDKKAAIVERFNRTLKTMMWKYFTAEGHRRWKPALGGFIANYNNATHRTIHMKPAKVTEKNKDKVWMTLYGKIDGMFPKPKFNITDKVRISKYKNIFEKGYETNFTSESLK